MTTDSATISIAVSSSPPKATAPGKGKAGKDDASDDDADAFSISLEVAREEADGDTATTSITIQGVTSEGDGANRTTGEPEADVTIEIETVLFSGDDLEQNLSASSVIGGASVASAGGGSFGVSGSITGESNLQLEVGETLTFNLPPGKGEVVGGQVTITNLFSDESGTEGALVFAYDAEGHQLASYFVVGDENGTVTVDIDVPFARLDFKAVDNGSYLLKDNATFGVSDVSAIFASITGELAQDASELIDDIVAGIGGYLPKLVDLGHFGAIGFEVSRVAAKRVSTLNALSSVRAGRGNETERHQEHDLASGLLDQRYQYQVGYPEL